MVVVKGHRDLHVADVCDSHISSRDPRQSRVLRSGSSGSRGCVYYSGVHRIATGGVMARPTTSVRLDEELRDRLSAAAAAENTTVTELIERFVREGLAVAGHPGIVFKPGPTGRRAALAGGPDVWEVVAALRHVAGPEAKRVRELAKQFGIHERQVAIALNYA